MSLPIYILVKAQRLCCSTVVGLYLKEIFFSQLGMDEKNVVTCVPLSADDHHPDAHQMYSAAYEEQMKHGKHDIGVQFSDSGLRMTSVTR